MADFYDLDGNQVSYEKWAEIFSGTDRFIAGSRIYDKNVRVSTVWIGLSWMDSSENDGRPLIFETMAFEDDDDSWDDLASWRWATYEEAVEGHQKVVDSITSGELVLKPLKDE